MGFTPALYGNTLPIYCYFKLRILDIIFFNSKTIPALNQPTTWTFDCSIKPTLDSECNASVISSPIDSLALSEVTYSQPIREGFPQK